MNILLVGYEFDDVGLACIRSLGKQGIYISCLNPRYMSPTLHSKYCKEIFISPHYLEKGKFLEYLVKILNREKFDVLLPYREEIIEVIYEALDDIERNTNVALPPKESFSITIDKEKTYNFCRVEKVYIPRTKIIRGYDDLLSTLSSIDYPCVIKHTKGHYIRGLLYAFCDKNIKKRFLKMLAIESYSKNDTFLVQEYIEGEEYSIHAIFNHGSPLVLFTYKKLRMLPIMGGTTAKAQSVLNDELCKISSKLLKKLKWHGVVNIDYKKDKKDGKFKLLDINPRFSDSIEVAVKSGVNLPYLYYLLAQGRKVDCIDTYQVNVIFRWIFIYLATIYQSNHIYIFLKDFFNKDIYSDIYIEDLKPIFFQFLDYIWRNIYHLRRGSLIYPCGRI